MASLDASTAPAAFDTEAFIDEMQSYFLSNSARLCDAINYLIAASQQKKLGLVALDAVHLIALRRMDRFDHQYQGLFTWTREGDAKTRCRALQAWLDNLNGVSRENERRYAEQQARAEQQRKQDEEAERKRREVLYWPMVDRPPPAYKSEEEEDDIPPDDPTRRRKVPSPKSEVRDGFQLQEVFVRNPPVLREAVVDIKRLILSGKKLEIHDVAGLISVDETRDFREALDKFMLWTRGSTYRLKATDEWLRLRGL